MSLTLCTLLAAAGAALCQDPVQDPRPVGGAGKARPPRIDVPLRFAVLGDFGTTRPESFEVAALVRGLAPRFLLTLGDNNYPDGEASTIDRNIGQHYHQFIHPYLGTYGPGASENRFFPTLGNHDWNTPGAQPYLDYFELPGNERYYDFVRGPLHFFALDSDPHEPDGHEPDSVQAEWLRTRLAASSAPFKVVYQHHAPFSSSATHGSTGPSQWPFAEWGATIVLAGHDHLYERLSVSGLTYVVNGLGGRNAYTFAAPLGATQVRFVGEHGALFVDAEEDFARFRFLTSTDVVQDDFVLPSTGLDPGVVPLIAADAEWRYLDTGIDPGPGWNDPSFDDSVWALGRAELGYGEGDEATVVSFGGNPNQRHVTTWFRRAFTLGEPDALERLELLLDVDDGAVAYLNGREVVRYGMPGGAITAATLASRAASGGDENVFEPHVFGTEALFRAEPGQLARGRNVLAVEVHQAALNSSDLGFTAELNGLRRGGLLLARGSIWRYRDDAAAPDASWKDADYDDAGWKTGRAQLGYGEDDERTRLAPGPATAWFRARFECADPSAVRWLSCRLLRDDGALVYLNGVEALRLNLPRTGVTPDTRAPFAVTQDQEDRFEEFSLDPRSLRAGTNTIAVEIHQSTQANPDLSFDLELVAH
jgi:hypothetical protein